MTWRTFARACFWSGAFVLGLGLESHAAGQKAPDDQPQAGERPGASLGPERLSVPGVENAFRLSPRLYSGAEPEGAAAFAALKALGIRTVISVDGAMPDVETAQRLGLRYVHLPIGYDGVPRDQALRIIQAVRTLPGPVYIHCHHGQHRGPAAAAVCARATEEWSKEQAVTWMKQAGTAPSYRGLYTAAETFAPPSPEELDRLGTEFPERVKPPALVGVMIQVDERWDHLKTVQKAGLKTPPDHPDIDPPHEALQLAEQFREALRLPEVREKGEDFQRKMEAAERQAAVVGKTLRAYTEHPGDNARHAADQALLGLSKGCADCHARYRDRRASKIRTVK